MNVEGIEHHRVTAARSCNLLGCRVSKRIGTPDDEGFERQSRVERRAASGILNGRAGRGDRFYFVPEMIDLALFKMRDHRRGTDGAGRHGTNRGRSHRQIDARYRWAFGLPTGEKPFHIVRLYPTFQEASWHRYARGVSLDTFEFHAREPAAVNGFPNLGTKAPFDARPAFIGNLGHFSTSYGVRIGRDESLIR